MVHNAVAWSAAAVLQPVAGCIDPADVDRLYGQVLLEELS
jgi:tagatose 6-phosphate kinase